MKSAALAAGFACLSLASGTAAAEWSGKGKLGGVLARGNADTATANANLDLTNTREQWSQKFGGTVLRTLTNDEISANRWEFRTEINYEPAGRVFAFGSLRYENDRLTDYEYQATSAMGVGYHLLKTERTKLNARIGAGIRRTELRLTGDVAADEIVRSSIEFERKLTGNTLLFNRYLVETGETNTFQQNTLGIEVKMTETLGVGLTYEVRRNTDVLPGTRNSDQVFSAGLVLGF